MDDEDYWNTTDTKAYNFDDDVVSINRIYKWYIFYVLNRKKKRLNITVLLILVCL